MIKILIVDDSATIREYLNYILSTDKELNVVGLAKDGKEAVDLVQITHPDVITMDIQMPRMDGYEATRKIMEIHPVPIVIISSLIPEDIQNTFKAMKAGAVAVLEKPKGLGHPEADNMVADIIQKIKLMSEVRVIRRFAKRQPLWVAEPKNNFKYSETVNLVSHSEKLQKINYKERINIVAIGVSTGGPPVIRTILLNMTKDFPVPILLVQHIASGFIKGMAEWLSKETGFSIKIPEHGTKTLPGNVYFAPDDFHMGITGNGEIILSRSMPENSLRPSVSYLFRSVTKAYANRAIGILLTGMGKDGAFELKEMKEKGAVTIAQDKESSVIHGMPGEAIKIDGATHILPPEKIAEFLNMAVGKR